MSSPPTLNHSPAPPPIPTLDTEAFRRKLAGLADPLARAADTPGEKAAVKRAAHRFCSILASLYDVPGDRTQLWGHVDKALETSLAKVSDDDLDAFASLCLESVKADPVKVAACGALASMIADFGAWSEEVRFAFLDYLRAHRYPVLVHGRARWQDVKEGRIEL